jgi:curved DNA-binding protein CbpA
MDPRLRTRVEIETLYGLVDELNYYRLLQLDEQCAQEDIGTAFRRESRRLHPDRTASLGDSKLKEQANYIFTAINEAFRTLKDPGSRLQYDQELANGSIRSADTSLRSADQAGGASDDPEQAATNPNSEKFWKLALRAYRDKNYSSCMTNIKFALQFEPDNAVFKEWMEKAQEADSNEVKKEKNPYKLRIL